MSPVHVLEPAVDQVNPIPVNPGNALCLDFVNSAFADHTGTSDRVFDRLLKPEWWKWLASRWQLSPPRQLTPADAGKLRRFRVRLRAMLEPAGRGRPLGHSELAWLNRRLARSPRRLSVPAGGRDAGLLLAPLSRNWDAIVAEVVFSYVTLVREGNPKRIRRCANPACSWLFYDDSRNLSRRWCDPRYCGNLIKVRRYRSRTRLVQGTG